MVKQDHVAPTFKHELKEQERELNEQEKLLEKEKQMIEMEEKKISSLFHRVHDDEQKLGSDQGPENQPKAEIDDLLAIDADRCCPL